MYGLYQIIYFTIIDILNTLKSPFFIAVLLIIYIQYFKIGNIEKETLGYKRSPLLKLISSTLFGMLGGVIATVLFLYLGIVLIPKDFIYILFTAIILSIIKPRYMCFAYAGGVVSLISLLFGYPQIKTDQIISVVAVLHIVESILILLDGWRSKLPVFLETKKNLIGGLNMNRFWPIPFVVFIGDGLIYPITLMAILSYSDYSISSYPNRKILSTSLLLFIYSTILLYITHSIENSFIPPLFSILGHEFIIWINKYKEDKKVPIFASTRRGLKVLQVMPNGIGKSVGIKTGDILIRINGLEVRDKNDLRDIMKINNDNLRVEYFDLKKGMSSVIYKGKKNSLGLITVPREF